MSDEEHITESELGTKDYWEQFYENELNNFEDSGDCGETWFGKRNTHRIIDWVVENTDKNATVCDVGCGNGYISSKLADLGFTKVIGIDYSEKAIHFCQKMHVNQAIKFKIVDILQDWDKLPSTIDQCDVLIDKGTYDAICLMPNSDLLLNRKLYMKFIIKHLKVNGHLLIMSCNFTKNELIKFLLNESSLVFVHEFETPKISFGGKTGNQVSGLVLKKCN